MDLKSTCQSKKDEMLNLSKEIESKCSVSSNSFVEVSRTPYKLVQKPKITTTKKSNFLFCQSCGENVKINRKSKKFYRSTVEKFEKFHCVDESCDHEENCQCEIKTPCSNCGDEFQNLNRYDDHVNKCFSGKVKVSF